MVVDAFDSVLAAARAGADWAWERIYADLAGSVIGYLRVHGAAEPEDLAGEVFLQVVRDLPRFSGDQRDFRAWVFTIVHRRLLDERRRRSEEHTSELQSRQYLVCRLLLEKKNTTLARTSTLT